MKRLLQAPLVFVAAFGLALGLTIYVGAQGPAVLRSSAGVELGTSAAPLRIDPTGTTTQPVSAASLPLPSGAAADSSLSTINTSLGTLLTTSDFDTKAGSLTETAPATDTASSGLNGRLQRIAQRITSLITALGSPFQAGGSIGNTSFGATNFPATVTLNAGAADASTLRAASDVRNIAGNAVVTAASGVQKVGLVGNAAVALDGATGAAPPANGVFIVGLGSGATGGLLLGVTVCDKDFDIDINTATTTLVVTGVSGRQVRICHFNMVATATDTVAWIEGTGATCGTGTAGMIGSSTAAHGQAFPATGGIAAGSGLGEILTTATTGDSVCLVTSAATQLDGHIKYAIY